MVFIKNKKSTFFVEGQLLIIHKNFEYVMEKKDIIELWWVNKKNRPVSNFIIILDESKYHVFRAKKFDLLTPVTRFL